jgi:16S rRNA (uracil1498-N3)-methyltransferase
MPHVHRFHVPPDTPGTGEVPLPQAEAHHALHVVRVSPGDAVILFDGAGRELTGHVARTSRRDVTVSVDAERHGPRPEARLTLVQAWLHREKAVDTLIRRGTEVGVSAFLFFQAERSERGPKPSDRWVRAAVEVCKQCGRLWLPEFSVARGLAGALQDAPAPLLMATQHAEPVPLRKAVQGDDIALLVGPEGDFTEDELELARAAGARPISLGAATYRSEAAAVLAASLILYERGALGPRGAETRP